MLKIKAKILNWKVLKTRVNITFGCDEIGENELMELIQLKGADGHLLFHIDEIKKELEEIIKDKKIAVDSNGLTQSQRLRKEIWTNWNEGDSTLKFDEFYLRAIEYFIKLLKDKRFKNRYKDETRNI